MEFISNSSLETERYASKLAAKLSGGVLALSGDLGAGKTTFVKGLAKGLGISKNITSPTFVILKSYQTDYKGDIKKLVHVDCYRMKDENDAEGIGLPEYFNQKDCLVLIEWPEKIKKILPESAKFINFEYLYENSRKITTDL